MADERASLDDRYCDKTHEHQQIAGQTWFKGKSVNRSKYAEDYGKPLARRLATAIINEHEGPINNHHAFDAVVVDAEPDDAEAWSLTTAEYEREQPGWEESDRKRYKGDKGERDNSGEDGVRESMWREIVNHLRFKTPMYVAKSWEVSELPERVQRIVRTLTKGEMIPQTIQSCRQATRTRTPTGPMKNTHPLRKYAYLETDDKSIRESMSEDWTAMKWGEGRGKKLPEHKFLITLFGNTDDHKTPPTEPTKPPTNQDNEDATPKT